MCVCVLMKETEDRERDKKHAQEKRNEWNIKNYGGEYKDDLKCVCVCVKVAEERRKSVMWKKKINHRIKCKPKDSKIPKVEPQCV